MEKSEWLRKRLTRRESIGVLKRTQKRIDKDLKWLYNLEKAEGGITMADIMEGLVTASLEELEEVKANIGALIKVKKEERKALAEQTFRKTVEEGDEVLFTFKGDEKWGKVVKLNEKSFTAEFDLDGETIKKAIQFHLFIGKANESEEADEDRAAV